MGWRELGCNGIAQAIIVGKERLTEEVDKDEARLKSLFSTNQSIFARLVKTINALFPLRNIQRQVESIKESLIPEKSEETCTLNLESIKEGDVIKIKISQHEYCPTPYVVKKMNSNFKYLSISSLFSTK